MMMRCLLVQKEQMMEAQEMFRTSNKVTRPEKALILGFMAGSRGEFCTYVATRFYHSYTTLLVETPMPDMVVIENL